MSEHLYSLVHSHAYVHTQDILLCSTNTRTDMCLDMPPDMSIDMYLDMCPEMYLDMCADMHLDTYLDMYTGICRHMCRHASIHVHRHVYRHVHSHVYRYARIPCRGARLGAAASHRTLSAHVRRREPVFVFADFSEHADDERPTGIGPMWQGLDDSSTPRQMPTPHPSAFAIGMRRKKIFMLHLYRALPPKCLDFVLVRPAHRP